MRGLAVQGRASGESWQDSDINRRQVGYEDRLGRGGARVCLSCCLRGIRKRMPSSQLPVTSRGQGSSQVNWGSLGL